MGSCTASFSSQVVEAIVFVSLLCFSSFSLYGCKGCLEEERIALLQLRDSLNYPNGSSLVTEWADDDCCEWEYVDCGLFNPKPYVIEIHLSFQRDVGIVDKWYPNASLFTHFKELQILSLDGNNIGGWSTSEGLTRGLKKLKTLDLHSNDLNDESFPSCLLHNNSVLENLDLSNNTLKGSIGFSRGLTCGLKKLKTLDLHSNDLNDESFLSCLLHKNSVLEELDLSDNNLKGSVGFSRGLTCGLKKLKTLDLHSNDLSDESLPSCLLHNNSVLEKLDLSENNLKGSVGFSRGLTCGLKKLKTLDLHSNDLSDEIFRSCLLHNNSVLEELDVSNNNLKGSVVFSRGLCNLRKLRDLDLNMNSIAGNMINWTCLSQLNSLEALDLGQNQISGTIPPLISNLTSLVRLDLSSNKLDGVFFFSMFANLSNLTTIDLSDNRDLEVETEFPSNWVPSFQLYSLVLRNCNLNKHSHGKIPHFISTQHQLDYLDLSYSSLQGTIPSWLFYNATPFYSCLYLRGNHLHGPFPLPFENQTSSRAILDISDNNFGGQFPRNMHVVFSGLEYLNMSANKLEGCIPPSITNLIYLNVLDLSNNHFEGSVPQGLTQNSTYLQFLILSNNHLHAMARVSNMTVLFALSLDGNLFTAPFQITPSTVPLLELLDISRNSMSAYIQHWLPAFPNLVALLMRGNHFVGYLPVASLCQMQQLRFLDLSDNRLSGTIPSCLNNITSWLQQSDGLFSNLGWDMLIEKDGVKINFATKGNFYSYEGLPRRLMTGIDFSLNQLSGDIPSQMGELKPLRSLNLSHNSLMGNFPESFRGLENLESLDLSHNRLVGIIPPQIIQLHSLAVFNVAFNQLSGKIPYEQQFVTFTNDSYIGNPGLCGPPIEVNCSSPDDQLPHHDESKEGDEQSLLDNHLFFYSLVAVSYILGFWVVVAPLLLSRNWRRKYYRVLDPYIYWCSEKLLWFISYFKNCW